jgi:glycosyltransferase involved in cell wall biosynthesis
MTSRAAPLVTVAIPVHNAVDTLPAVVESVLGQTFTDLEVVISDNASTDGTDEVCRHFASLDERVVHQRHPTNVGLLNNFGTAAHAARGTYVRWVGDDDQLAPDYVSRVLACFEEDPRRVLVTTQMSYVERGRGEWVRTGYDPTPLASPDPATRFVGAVRLLTVGFGLIDPLYGMMRRELAVLPRQSALREDEVFGIRLALAGPWGHLPVTLATRHHAESAHADLARLLGVPTWHLLVKDVLQSRELLRCIDASSLTASGRRRARASVLALYARRKRDTARRAIAKLERATRPAKVPSRVGP